jgi:ABC-type multidrug transport system ATPase subunit
LQSYNLELKCDIPDSYRVKRAANSLDIDVEKKSTHKFAVKADIDTDYSIGLIVGASGSGKTTFANHVFGQDCFKEYLDKSKPVIEQFPKEMGYDDCAKLLSGVGLTSVPCWIRPAHTLSNGQRSRAEAALALCNSSDSVPVVIDEWTSVVDRTVAKVMSHCVQKHARKQKKRIILLSCHYDVIE